MIEVTKSHVTMDSIQVKMQMASHVTESWERRLDDSISRRMLLGAVASAAKRQAFAEPKAVDVLPKISENRRGVAVVGFVSGGILGISVHGPSCRYRWMKYLTRY